MEKAVYKNKELSAVKLHQYPRVGYKTLLDALENAGSMPFVFVLLILLVLYIEDKPAELCLSVATPWSVAELMQALTAPPHVTLRRWKALQLHEICDMLMVTFCNILALLPLLFQCRALIS